MAFNGIIGAVNVPGEIPWEVVAGYFVVALATMYFVGKKYATLKSFTTLDLVYIGIGGAFAVVWEFYVASFIDRFLPSTPFLHPGDWGRLIIVLIVAGLVRKPGVGMLTLFIFDVLADLFHYGFGGQPMYFIYETLTYGLYVDLVIVFAKGKIFGIGYTPKEADQQGVDQPIAAFASRTNVLAALEGGIVGALWTLPEPLFYDGFLRPFIYAYAPNWGRIVFDIITALPGEIVMGMLGGILAYYVARAVGQ
jgi:hypothetical protein